MWKEVLVACVFAALAALVVRSVRSRAPSVKKLSLPPLHIPPDVKLFCSIYEEHDGLDLGSHPTHKRELTAEDLSHFRAQSAFSLPDAPPELANTLTRAVDDALKQLRMRSTLAVKVRIQSCRWYFGVHYDCYDNHLVLLSGRKRVLSFRHPSVFLRDGQAAVKSLMEELQSVPLDEARHKLGVHGINASEHHLRAGDILFLPMGTFHMIENEGQELVCFANLISTCSGMARCESFFRDLWPKQRQACESQKCIQ